MKTNWDSHWEEESNRSYWREPDKAVIQLIETLDKSRIKDVLDLGCGIGRHAIYFAEVGFNVTAVDSSPKALAILRQQVVEKELEVKSIEGDYSEELFPEESFDFVLAYNVIYHGYRQNMEHAINLIHKLLKPQGLFFFTCPTTRDDKYGNGEELAQNTYKPLNSVHPGDIHYFANESDILDFLGKFSEFSKDVYEHHWDNDGARQFSLHWQILARK